MTRFPLPDKRTAVVIDPMRAVAREIAPNVLAPGVRIDAALPSHDKLAQAIDTDLHRVWHQHPGSNLHEKYAIDSWVWCLVEIFAEAGHRSPRATAANVLSVTIFLHWMPLSHGLHSPLTRLAGRFPELTLEHLFRIVPHLDRIRVFSFPRLGPEHAPLVIGPVKRQRLEQQQWDDLARQLIRLRQAAHSNFSLADQWLGRAASENWSPKQLEVELQNAGVPSVSKDRYF